MDPSTTMENVIIKTEPVDTYGVHYGGRAYGMDNENPLSEFVSRSSKAQHGEPESLMMVCESENDGDSARMPDGNNFYNSQQRLLEKKERKQSANDESSSASIEFKSIRGLPVNLPFRVRYSSSAIDGVVESKVYMIQEYTGEVPLSPIIVNVMGVHEIPTSAGNSKDSEDTSKSTSEDRNNEGELYGKLEESYNYDTDTDTDERYTNLIDLNDDNKTDYEVISSVLNDVIDSVVKLDEMQAVSVSEQFIKQEEHPIPKKRRNSSRLMTVRKQPKVIKLREKSEKKPRSSRVLKKGGYRIKYIGLDELDKTKKQRQSYSEKCKEERLLKRVTAQKLRISVILSEHTDKYYIEDQMSAEMQHRGRADPDKTFKLMVCKECQIFRTEDKRLMETHIEYHVNGDLTCPECDFKASAVKEMAIHKNIHPNLKKKKNFACLLCEERFPVQQQYHNHLTTVHDLLPYLCSVCSTKESPVTFKDLQDYKDHYIENHKELMKQCTVCGLYHLHRRSLRNHVCTGKLKQEVPCDICGKELRPQSLANHKKTVHFNVRRYPCPECKYAASHPLLLQQHTQARHAGIHNYKCNQCDFTCVRPYQLTSHTRTHTGDKPYKCEQCPYAAAWNVQLKDHKKLHGSTLGIDCEKCGILLRTGAPYTKHMKKEHGMAQGSM